jgi:hypothetical protein
MKSEATGEVSLRNIPVDEARRFYQGTVENLKKMEDFVKVISSRDLTVAYRNTNIFAAFHTHSIMEDNPYPTPPDKAASFLGGPEFVFAQKDRMLHVYAINRGEVVVYTAKLP